MEIYSLDELFFFVKNHRNSHQSNPKLNQNIRNKQIENNMKVIKVIK